MNLASIQQGTEVIGASSEVTGCEARNILTDDLSQIWLSEDGIPQWICLSLLHITHQEDTAIRSIGWHCWHAYSTNPKEIRVHVSHDGVKFKIWDSLIAVGSQRAGTQLFCCDPIYVHIYPYLAFEIMSTYGGTQTYLNQIYLYSEEIALTSSTLLTSEDDSGTEHSEEATETTSHGVRKTTGGSIPRPQRRRPSNSGNAAIAPSWTQFPTTLTATTSNLSSVSNSPARPSSSPRQRRSSHTSSQAASELSEDSLLSLTASPESSRKAWPRSPSFLLSPQRSATPVLPPADDDLPKDLVDDLVDGITATQPRRSSAPPDSVDTQELLASIDSLANNTSLLVEKLQLALGLANDDHTSQPSTPRTRSRTNSQSHATITIFSPEEMEAKLLENALFGTNNNINSNGNGNGNGGRSRSNSAQSNMSSPAMRRPSYQSGDGPVGILKSPAVTFNTADKLSTPNSSNAGSTGGNTNLEELLAPGSTSAVKTSFDQEVQTLLSSFAKEEAEAAAEEEEPLQQSVEEAEELQPTSMSNLTSSASKAESLLSDRHSLLYHNSLLDHTTANTSQQPPQHSFSSSAASTGSNDVRSRLLELENKLHSIHSMVQQSNIADTTSRSIPLPAYSELQPRRSDDDNESNTSRRSRSVSSDSVASQSSWPSVATSTSSYAPISPTLHSKPFPLEPEDVVVMKPTLTSSANTFLFHTAPNNSNTSKLFSARSTSPSRLRQMLEAINKLKEEMEAELETEHEEHQQEKEHLHQESLSTMLKPALPQSPTLDRSTSIGSFNMSPEDAVEHKSIQATPSTTRHSAAATTSPSRLVLREMAVQADPYTELLEAAHIQQQQQGKTSKTTAAPSSSSPSRRSQQQPQDQHPNEADYFKLLRQSRPSTAGSYLSEDEQLQQRRPRRLREQDLNLHDIPSRNKSTEDIMEQMLENIRYKARLAADQQHEEDDTAAEAVSHVPMGRKSRSPSPTRLRASTRTMDERIDDEISAMRERFFNQHVSPGSTLRSSAASLPAQKKASSRTASPSLFRQPQQAVYDPTTSSSSRQKQQQQQFVSSMSEPKLIPSMWSVEQKIRDIADRSLHQAAANNNNNNTFRSNTTTTSSSSNNNTSRSTYLLTEHRREVPQYGEEDLEHLVQELHAKVLQRTVKEAQLRILSQQPPSSSNKPTSR